MCQCCEEADPSAALEKLKSRVNELQLSMDGLLERLRTVQEKALASYKLSLVPLLEDKGRERSDEESTSSRNTGGNYFVAVFSAQVKPMYHPHNYTVYIYLLLTYFVFFLSQIFI